MWLIVDLWHVVNFLLQQLIKLLITLTFLQLHLILLLLRLLIYQFLQCRLVDERFRFLKCGREIGGTVSRLLLRLARLLHRLGARLLLQDRVRVDALRVLVEGWRLLQFAGGDAAVAFNILTAQPWGEQAIAIV